MSYISGMVWPRLLIEPIYLVGCSWRLRGVLRIPRATYPMSALRKKRVKKMCDASICLIIFKFFLNWVETF